MQQRSGKCQPTPAFCLGSESSEGEPQAKRARVVPDTGGPGTQSEMLTIPEHPEQRQGLELSPALRKLPLMPLSLWRGWRQKAGRDLLTVLVLSTYPAPGPPAVLAQDPEAQLLMDLLPPCGHSVCHLCHPHHSHLSLHLPA